jgi:hypothetical protein
MARQIGLDGYYLLQQIWGINDEELREHNLWSVEVLRRVWIQQYTWLNQQLVWRTPDSTGLPPNSICIESPYDIEARNSSKRGEHPNFARRQERGKFIRELKSRIKPQRCGCCNNGGNDCS